MLKNVLKASLLVALVLVIPKIGNCLTDTKTGNISSSFSASLTSTLLEQKPEVCGSSQTVSSLISSVPTCGGCGGCTTTETYEDMVLANCLKESIYQDCGLTCNHVNNYNYSFLYEINQNNAWNALANTEAHKCEKIRVTFNPIADWGATLDNACVQRSDSQSYTKTISVSNRTVTVTVPPTNILTCASQDDCLSQATESQLNTNIYGKGVQQIPANWVTTTQNSLTGSDTNLSCANGNCEAYEGGNYSLTATAPGSVYYGQCRGFDMTLNTPGANIGAVASTITAPIINRPPTGSVTISNNSFMPEQEVQVTCNVTDPDCANDAAHMDKIARIRWICVDSNGINTNCFMRKTQTGTFAQGGFADEIPTAERSNPYTAYAYFKSTANGNYNITCEAWDDDLNASRSSVVGTTNVGVVPASGAYCAILPDEEGGSVNTVCGESQKVNYNAYYSGEDPAAKYVWKCSDTGETVETIVPKVSCSYGSVGTYTPTLSIITKGGKTLSTCASQTKTEVKKEPQCQVKLNQTSAAPTETVNATLDRQCFTGGTVTWEVPNGTKTQEDNNSAVIKFNSQGDQTVKAQVTTSTGTLNCGVANINISGSAEDARDKIQWGN